MYDFHNTVHYKIKPLSVRPSYAKTKDLQQQNALQVLGEKRSVRLHFYTILPIRLCKCR